MRRKFECEVTTANGHKFLIEYDSQMNSKDDAFKATSIIKKVFLCGYPLALGQLREMLVWSELVAAVDNNAIFQWDNFWTQHDLREQTPTLQRQDKINTDNLHPVFKDIFDTLGEVLNPKNNKL